MGLSGPLTRAAEQLKADDTPVLIPQPGIDLVPLVQDEWDDFWTSKVSRFTDDVDMGSLRRLFVYRNEWMQLAIQWAGFEGDERFVEGTNRANAIRLHPLGARMAKLEALMLPLEDRFGMSPLSRARLGIEVGSLHLTWRQVQQSDSPSVGVAPVHSSLPVGGSRELNE